MHQNLGYHKKIREFARRYRHGVLDYKEYLNYLGINHE
jgi:hypothetical protein